jgi:phage gp36-like protein
MSYITQDDIAKRIGLDKLVQLTDNAGSGEVDSDRVAEAIAYAEGTVESYARTRYQLPLPLTPQIKSRCLDLAIFDLYKDRATDSDGVYKIRKDQQEAAIVWLRALQKGEAALDVAAAQETVTNPGSPDSVLSGPSKQNPSPFGREKLRGF